MKYRYIYKYIFISGIKILWGEEGNQEKNVLKGCLEGDNEEKVRKYQFSVKNIKINNIIKIVYF